MKDSYGKLGKENLTLFGRVRNFQYPPVIVSYMLYVFICFSFSILDVFLFFFEGRVRGLGGVAVEEHVGVYLSE